MENLSNGDFWRAIMGESDSDEGGFEGFSLDEINKKDESDIDLDVVVNDEQLLREFESSDSDRDSDNHGDSGDSDIILPVLAAPNPRRKKKRLSKQNRNELTTRWSDRTTPVQPKKFDVGVTPVGPRNCLWVCHLRSSLVQRRMFRRVPPAPGSVHPLTTLSLMCIFC